MQDMKAPSGGYRRSGPGRESGKHGFKGFPGTEALLNDEPSKAEMVAF
jgi:acyl-CoA reductase-like NAD-dependent aldehyde dehydrogenase